jgi:Fe-S-cluster containining protein
VTGSREELRRAPKLNNPEYAVKLALDGKVIWDSGCLTCPYVTDAGCGIYEDRPLICRIFGASEEPALQCPHGRKPEKPLTSTQTRTLFDRYLKIGGLAKPNENKSPFP